MNDKELLELAAKAAGYEVDIDHAGLFYIHEGTGQQSWSTWNPLTDDGDALRLAVNLKLLGSEDSQLIFAQFESGDPYAATRRAIVRAAAEIGRMK